MIFHMFFGMRYSLGPFSAPWSWLANVVLLLQFPIGHSVLLTGKGRAFLKRLAPGLFASDLSTTTYVIVASLQVFLLFNLWSFSGIVWWQASGVSLVVPVTLYAASWLFLGLAILNAGITQQSGFLGWWAVFLVVPVGLVIAYSVFQRGTYGGVVPTFTLDNFVRALDPLYLRVFLFSLRVAVIATVIALLIGYPAAYFIATLPRRWRTPVLVLVILPFWTSLLIRTYAWIVLLNGEGLINRGLESLGLIKEPLPLLYNEFAIVLGLVYGYLPLMILPIYSSIERLQPELREASADLGGNPIRTFLRVTLPLTLPGLAAGCIFVFVPSLGNFIVPDLLGGGLSIMVGNLIQAQFLKARDWPFGAVLSLALIAMMGVLLFIQAWLQDRDRQQAIHA